MNLLECRSPETKVGEHIIVLRCPNPKQSIVYFSANPQIVPTDLFHLSDDDKADGVKSGKQPLLSVWDHSFPESELRKRRGYLQDQQLAVFELPAKEIHAIQSQHVPVEVHWDHIDGDAFGKLHAGIQGLYKQPGVEKGYYKDIKDQLRQICKLLKK